MTKIITVPELTPSILVEKIATQALRAQPGRLQADFKRCESQHRPHHSSQQACLPLPRPLAKSDRLYQVSNLGLDLQRQSFPGFKPKIYSASTLSPLDIWSDQVEPRNLIFRRSTSDYLCKPSLELPSRIVCHQWIPVNQCFKPSIKRVCEIEHTGIVDLSLWNRDRES